MNHRFTKTDYLHKWELIASKSLIDNNDECFLQEERQLYNAGIHSKLVKDKDFYKLYVSLKHASIAKDLVEGNVSEILGKPIGELLLFDSELNYINDNKIIDTKAPRAVKRATHRSILFMLVTILIMFVVGFFIIPR